MANKRREAQREARQARLAALAAQQRAAKRRRAAIAVGLLVAVVGAIFWIFNSGDDDDGPAANPATSTTSAAGPAALQPVAAGRGLTGDTPCPPADGSAPRTSTFAKAPPTTCIDPAKTYRAVFHTTEGEIEVALDARSVPGTVANFVVLSRYHYYDGSGIHRTDPSIEIIQGGSPNTQSASDPGPGYTIKDEGTTDRRYTEGDLVMARTSGPDSAGAQYFFVAGPGASALDSQGTYVTFGKVVRGLDVVKKILGLHAPYPAGSPNASLGGAPSRAVVVNRITVTES